MNNEPFHMDSINIITYLNNVEIWKLSNSTMVAHPFHIHDIEFFVLDINGLPPPPQYQGLKDVILVQPKDTVRFITKFTTFTDPMVPYMYHCHLLHHEDDGMMGTFLVLDPAAIGIKEQQNSYDPVKIFPNPSNGTINLDASALGSNSYSVKLLNSIGEEVIRNESTEAKQTLSCLGLRAGLYTVVITADGKQYFKKIVIN